MNPPREWTKRHSQKEGVENDIRLIQLLWTSSKQLVRGPSSVYGFHLHVCNSALPPDLNWDTGELLRWMPMRWCSWMCSVGFRSGEQEGHTITWWSDNGSHIPNGTQHTTSLHMEVGTALQGPSLAECLSCHVILVWTCSHMWRERIRAPSGVLWLCCTGPDSEHRPHPRGVCFWRVVS